VTEELTQVNLPATQLQVGMGIPLTNMPQIRRFYGRDTEDVSDKIDFMEDTYVYPDRHVIASRITAENPDDGFKPTSGKINRIKFQSSVSCWGYFSVGANGAIHEYADSQFGHIFAHGTTREEARKSLMLALRNIDVVGEIRNPVEYLVELLGLEAFVNNTITTSWLDGIIKEKTVEVDYNKFDVVFYSAVFRAVRKIEEDEKELLASLGKSQLGMLDEIGSMNRFPIEITFEGGKYTFQVQREGPTTLSFTINGQRIVTDLESRPDGSIFVTVGSSNMTIFGTEEALGLRLRMEGVATVMVPTIYDASELRSEFNGKIVRYLQDNGAPVKAGQPYVELEAMKMIMPVKAMASGKIEHTRGAGSIVAAGELLGQLQLDDPSSVQKIVAFEGQIAPTVVSEGDTGAEADIRTQVDLAMDGFARLPGSDGRVQVCFSKTSLLNQADLACEIFDRYLAVEEKFAALVEANLNSDQVFLKLIEENKDSLLTVVNLARAHKELVMRNAMILSTLRSIQNQKVGKDVVERIERLAKLPSGGGYGEVALLARQYAEKLNAKPFDERRSALASALKGSPDFQAIASMRATDGGSEILGDLLGSSDSDVRKNALEALMNRTFRMFSLKDLTITDSGPSDLSCGFKFQYPGTSANQTTREAWVKVVPGFSDIKSVLQGEIPMTPTAGNVNTIKVCVGPDAFTSSDSSDSQFEQVIAEVGKMLKENEAALLKAGVREFGLMALQAPKQPRYASFRLEDGWAEGAYRRDMRPSFSHLLEISTLAKSYDLERIVPVMGRNSQVFVGVQKGEAAGKMGKPTTVFARMITHTFDKVDDSGSWMVKPELLLLSGLDEVERARLNPKIGTKPNSQIFANFLTLVDLEPAVADALFESFLNQFVAKHGRRLQKSKVDEIVMKIGLGGDKGQTHTLRLTASSLTGEYLRTFGVLEQDDPLTGLPAKFIDVKTGEERSLQPVANAKMQRKREIARAAGSTYAPEFLGMLKQELVKKWYKYKKAGGDRRQPTSLFEDVELVLGPDGELVESNRAPGDNNVGVLAWRCTLQTPEYPKGRDIVLIANDVTYQAGSFGVAEDVMFEKASQYARERGLPRIHIACNSGARVGLVEELKPFIKAKWIDPADPSKGFSGLYLTEEDYAKFDKGVVEAREDTYEGKKIYVLDGIIGEGLKSTAGGIGVENLQGSGLIAGETSRAYDETFTLSYITGRSVGIGAYLNRLGQRNIQMVHGPMILTGYQALNKLLGQQVYTTQDQLGGPHIMVPNGVTHELVQDDLSGAEAMLRWLAFVPQNVHSIPPIVAAVDPIDRQVGFMPTKSPYDPRHMLAGTRVGDEYVSGFCDEGSFHEYMEGWGKTVCVARARLGGMPVGIVAVETRAVERHIPADPADNTSRDVKEAQAGQVWYPDSAHKTAQAIRDFNRGENLPLIIFANWRGFSGGTRDMFAEVLKYGAMIVDALVEYKQPVTIYIPPNGELRGGAWVVLDPKINPQQMEMFADVEARGGILEPPAAAEIVFKGDKHVLDMMHRLDDQLVALDAKAKAGENVAAAIKEREKLLLPTYRQVSVVYCDLHDRSGRMKGLGAIHEELEWKNSRTYLHWRIRRRVQENGVAQQLMAEVRDLDHDGAMADVREMCKAAGVAEDKAVAQWIEGHHAEVAACVEKARQSGIEREIYKLVGSLPAEKRSEVVRDLVGFSKVAGAA